MTARVWPISPVRLSRLFGASVLISATLLFSSQLALAQFSQQGSKLVGTGGAGGAAQQGWSVTVSADGNTAILGGPADNSQTGAAWVFTRSGTTWTQQQKLAASDGAAGAAFGTSVALSADGNTAIVGGPGQNVGGTSGAGTAYVFVRSGTTWTQQQELTASDGVAGAAFGTSVALSGDTAIVGGPGQNSGAGAAYVYTRSGTTWAQQQELVCTGAVGTVHTQPATGQGWSVALSADGNTAIVGGPADNSQTRAAWVFTRSGVTWSQQGSKLVGTDLGAGPNYQGYSVALSADGNTAIVGGFGDNAGTGAAWVYTRSGTAWSQQGSKLVGSGVTGRTAEQGFSVALSSDGNTAIVGGPADNGFIGAAWVYTRSGTAWTQLQKLVGTGAVELANEGSSVALSSDGNTAIVGGPQDSGNNTTGAAWVFVTPSVPFLAFRAQPRDRLWPCSKPRCLCTQVQLHLEQHRARDQSRHRAGNAPDRHLFHHHPARLIQANRQAVHLCWGHRRRESGGADHADGHFALRVRRVGTGCQLDRNHEPGNGETKVMWRNNRIKVRLGA